MGVRERDINQYQTVELSDVYWLVAINWLALFERTKKFQFNENVWALFILLSLATAVLPRFMTQQYGNWKLNFSKRQFDNWLIFDEIERWEWRKVGNFYSIFNVSISTLFQNNCINLNLNRFRHWKFELVQMLQQLFFNKK